MGRVTIESDHWTKEVPKGESLLDHCQGTSILFGCGDGSCGSCLIRVVSGSDVLSPPSEEEKDFLSLLGSEEDERLACQCFLERDADVVVDVAD